MPKTIALNHLTLELTIGNLFKAVLHVGDAHSMILDLFNDLTIVNN